MNLIGRYGVVFLIGDALFFCLCALIEFVFGNETLALQLKLLSVGSSLSSLCGTTWILLAFVKNPTLRSEINLVAVGLLALNDFFFSLTLFIPHMASFFGSNSLLTNGIACTVTAWFAEVFGFGSVAWNGVLTSLMVWMVSSPKTFIKWGNRKRVIALFCIAVWGPGLGISLYADLTQSLGVSSDDNCWISDPLLENRVFSISIGFFLLSAMAVLAVSYKLQHIYLGMKGRLSDAITELLIFSMAFISIWMWSFVFFIFKLQTSAVMVRAVTLSLGFIGFVNFLVWRRAISSRTVPQKVVSASNSFSSKSGDMGSDHSWSNSSLMRWALVYHVLNY